MRLQLAMLKTFVHSSTGSTSSTGPDYRFELFGL